ncbi:MAG: HAD hydrolase-like protein, partial [Bacteroidota bacterium]
MKTLIIFDIDGTMVYSNRIDSQCFALTYEQLYGLPFPTIDWITFPHVTDHTIFQTVIQLHFGRLASEAEMDEFQHHFVAMIEQKRHTEPREFQEIPAAKITVERLLGDDRFEVGIGTGGWLRPANVKLRHVEIPAERLTMSCADGKETREAIIGQAISEVEKRTRLERVVYVGDAIWDAQVTRRMG